jgi:glycosyltransferase involved in cell wall biosynthesis
MNEEKKTKSKILFISELGLKTAGNQSLFNTLNGYAKAGYEVHFMNIKMNNESRLPYTLHKNIKIFNYSYFPICLYPYWTFFRKRIASIENRVFQYKRKIKQNSAKEDILKKDLQINNIPSYIPGAPETITVNFLSKISWILFQIIGGYHCFRLMRKNQYDLFYGYEIMGIPLAYTFGKLRGKKIVSRFQGTFLFPILNNTIKKLFFFEHVIAFKLRADLVIMTNDGTKGDKVLEYFGFPKNRIFFLINGVDKTIYIDNFNVSGFKEKTDIPKDHNIIITLSKLAYWKRVDRIINAMPLVLSKERNVFLIVIGDGPQKSSLQKMANSLGVANNIKFIGNLSHNQVKEYLNGADLFTTFYDLSNLGNPLLEALTCGKCIISLNDGSLEGIITDGKNGILLNSDGAEFIASAIIECIRNKDKRSTLEKNAKKFSDTQLKTWEERMNDEINAVQNLIS